MINVLSIPFRLVAFFLGNFSWVAPPGLQAIVDPEVAQIALVD